MGNIFGKKKSSRVTEQDKAVLQLKQLRDQLKQYQKKIIIRLDKDKQTAKILISNGKKEKALLILKKKRFQESLLNKTDGQLENIERMVHDLEYAQIEVKVVEGLKTGNDALKKLQKLISLEDIEKIMDETKEAAEYQQEIVDILAGGLTDQDIEDVEKELLKITEESLPAVLQEEEELELPSVPEHAIDDKQPQRQQVLLEAS